MKDSRHIIAKLYNRRGHLGKSGVAAVEMAIILPLMLIIVFAIIDFGRIVQARLVITTLAREGGSVASHGTPLVAGTQTPAMAIITMLQDGASPLDLVGSGRIYITKIRAGTATSDPYIDTTASASAGGMPVSVQSSIGPLKQHLGLSSTMYEHLVFHAPNGADISEVNVVEVNYWYQPISPISNFIPGLLTSSGGGTILSSKAVF